MQIQQNFTLSSPPMATIRTLAVLLLAMFISACDPSVYSTDVPQSNTPSQSSPAELARRGNHTQAALAYRKLAERSTGIQRDKYYLEAADQWFRANRYRDSQIELYKIRSVLDSEAQIRKILLQTRIEIELDQPIQALSTIDALNPDSAANIARPYYALRGIALFRLGRLVEGTESFLTRENYLDSVSVQQDNRRRLWNNLSNATSQGFQDDTQDVETDVAAWILLAQNLAFARNEQQQINILNLWRQDFPGHPAYRYAADNLPKVNDSINAYSGNSLEQTSINNIAVLIPLSGRLGRAGQEIQKGINAANRNQTDSYNIAFYDTANDVYTAYQEAMRSRPDVIVGPLNKDNIRALADRPLDVPMLALNRAYDNQLNQSLSSFLYNNNAATDSSILNSGSKESLDVQPAPYNLIQFGLAPEDEARVAADAALQNGHTQMVTLTPNNEWGDRVLLSFAQTFVAGGGKLLESQQYSTRENDHTNVIQAMLNLDESEIRHNQVTALFGEVEYEPRRRTDVDAIFIGAQPQQGRLIRPQLKFHYANNLPVYATSSIYAADASKNKDINGIKLPLSTWEANPYLSRPELANTLNIIDEDQIPNTQILRLFGLGFDAIQYLSHLSQNPQEDFIGLTGTLSINENGIIERNLPMTIIRNGKPEN